MSLNKCQDPSGQPQPAEPPKSSRSSLERVPSPVQFLSSASRAKPLPQMHLKLPMVFLQVPWVHSPENTLHSFTSGGITAIQGGVSVNPKRQRGAQPSPASLSPL